jgi:hypothetical protein
MKNPNFRKSFGWYIPPPKPLWAVVSDGLITENQDLDYFSLSVEDTHPRCPEINDYAKYTIEQFKFDDDYEAYYGI